MRALLRVVCLLALAATAATILFYRELALTDSPVMLTAAVIVVAVLGAVFGLTFRRQAADSTATPQPGLLAETMAAPAQSDERLEERAMLIFARHLLAAGSGEALLATIERELPPMLGGRRVWVTWEQPARPGVAHARMGERLPQSLLTDRVQEWTTFTLRQQEQTVGLLGIESPGGLSTPLKQSIQVITPLLAQAIGTMQEVDVFREASVLDLLTGAVTRREGIARLQAEVKRGQRTGSTMAVLMIDLDHFKSINDQYGHPIGDLLLTALGQTMQRTLRASDLRCRWGGEEFLIAVPDTTLAQAQIVATHLLQNIAATAVPSSRGPVSSTASIGVTVSRPGETDVDRIIARADMALYQAKNAGRACIRVVLGGFDGEPVGTSPNRPLQAPLERPDGTLPFPDRRDPNRRDRRQVPSPGRRRTDPPTGDGPSAPPPNSEIERTRTG